MVVSKWESNTITKTRTLLRSVWMELGTCHPLRFSRTGRNHHRRHLLTAIWLGKRRMTSKELFGKQKMFYSREWEIQRYTSQKQTIDKVECITRKFTSNSTLDSSRWSLLEFPLRTEFVMCDMYITPFVVSVVIFKLDQ